MVADVLRRLDLADELGGVAADALARDLEHLDDAVGVDDERGALGEAGARAHDVEVGGDGTAGVAEHEVLHLGDRVGGRVPRLVREVGVGRDRVHLDAEALQLLVVVGEVAELGGADEGEVGGVEEHDRPVAAQVGVGDVDELAVLERRRGEGLDLGTDEQHAGTPGGWGAAGEGGPAADENL